MYDSAQLAIMDYAQLALRVVLDQHELSILPARVQTILHENGDISLLHKTADLTAIGSFTGTTQSGTLTLGEVRTKTWQRHFGTRDRFRGTRRDGLPHLLLSGT